MSRDISLEALEKIQRERIRPVDKRWLRLRNVVLWLGFFFFLWLGGVAASVVIYMLKSGDWDLLGRADGDWLKFFLATVPFVWFVLWLIFLAAAYIYFRRTKHGYIHRFSAVGLFSLFVCLLFGNIFYFNGWGEKFELLFAEQLPLYNHVCRCREEFWSRPEQGLLAGVVVDVSDRNNFKIIDFQSRFWGVSGQNIIYHNLDGLRDDLQIKIIGQVLDDDDFLAEEVRPWFGRWGDCYLQGRCGFFDD